MSLAIKVALLAAVAAAAAHSSGAMAQGSPGLPLVPLGYCQLTSLGSSVGLASCAGGIPVGARVAIIRAEAQALRYRDDGTAPTASVGQPIAIADPPLLYAGPLTALRFIEQTGGGKINVLFYRSPGSP